MSNNSTLALFIITLVIIITVQFAVGALVGIAAAALIRRFRLRSLRALVTAFTAGTVFECALRLAGSVTLDSNPFSNCPHIVGFLDRYPYPFAILCCLSVAASMSLVPPKRKASTQRQMTDSTSKTIGGNCSG